MGTKVKNTDREGKIVIDELTEAIESVGEFKGFAVVAVPAEGDAKNKVLFTMVGDKNRKMDEETAMKLASGLQRGSKRILNDVLKSLLAPILEDEDDEPRQSFEEFLAELKSTQRDSSEDREKCKCEDCKCKVSVEVENMSKDEVFAEFEKWLANK